MVESRRALPLIQGVTAQTVSPQLPTMTIFVAGETIARQAEEGAIQVFNLHDGALCRGDVLGVVALLACNLRMLAL